MWIFSLEPHIFALPLCSYDQMQLNAMLVMAWRGLQSWKVLVKFLRSRKICKSVKSGEGSQAGARTHTHTHSTAQHSTGVWKTFFLEKHKPDLQCG